MRAAGAVLAVALLVGACGDDPVQVEFEVIEELDFAPSLEVDLGAMELTATGVYWQDLVVGDGEEAVFGTTPTVTYTGWLADGTEFDSGQFDFFMGAGQVIPGFEDGLLNARVGGTRRMVIPPNRAYGGQSIQTGSTTIPPGAVLVFEVTVDSVLAAEG